MIVPMSTKPKEPQADRLGNKIALEGCDRCYCGCKYWENDKCIDCGTHITDTHQVHQVQEGTINPRYRCVGCGWTITTHYDKAWPLIEEHESQP
jgi:DNA-directed RNA polymerase subunit N (RpoN/RPB10)